MAIPPHTLPPKTWELNKLWAGEEDRQDFRKIRKARTSNKLVSLPSLLYLAAKDRRYMKWVLLKLWVIQRGDGLTSFYSGDFWKQKLPQSTMYFLSTRKAQAGILGKWDAATIPSTGFPIAYRGFGRRLKQKFRKFRDRVSWWSSSSCTGKEKNSSLMLCSARQS